MESRLYRCLFLFQLVENSEEEQDEEGRPDRVVTFIDTEPAEPIIVDDARKTSNVWTRRYGFRHSPRSSRRRQS